MIVSIPIIRGPSGNDAKNEKHRDNAAYPVGNLAELLIHHSQPDDSKSEDPDHDFSFSISDGSPGSRETMSLLSLLSETVSKRSSLLRFLLG